MAMDGNNNNKGRHNNASLRGGRMLGMYIAIFMTRRGPDFPLSHGV